MKKVPKMLTSKDVLYLEDVFNWNITATRKLDFYNTLIDDKNMNDLFNDIASMHYEICDNIIHILESGDEDER